jgi:peptidoglycan/xylan/chitin deacetylase (PgdA/CDA1 family)
MNSKVAIVTHHYVRNVECPQNSKINEYSIGISDFIKRVDYYQKQYSIITPDMFINSIKYKTSLPQNSILLTFDDGYIDHYKLVFPILLERGLKAFFFPSAMPILEGKMLNTNKLQIILGKMDKESLYTEILSIVNGISPDPIIEIMKNLVKIDNVTEKENAISAFLEWEAPIDISTRIIDTLFNKLVGKNERALSKELYMNISQLNEMKAKGMHIGCHGYSHYCMGFLTDRLKNEEINKSLKLINLINGSKRDWVMCYPYGSFDRSLVSTIKKYGCLAGFTTIDKIADLSTDEIYTLPRVDVSSSRL